MQHPQPKKDQLTLPRNISRDNLPTTQPNPSGLPLPRVRLLRLRNPRLQTHALHLRPVLQRRGPRATRALRHSAPAPDLVVRRLAEGGGRELAEGSAGGGEGRWRAEDGLESGEGRGWVFGEGDARRDGEGGALDEGPQGAEGEGGDEGRHVEN